MFEPGQRVGVAVSGGADSVFLLNALRHLAPRWGLRLAVIRRSRASGQFRGPASIADAEFVAQLAVTFGLPFHFRQADVPAIDGNLEEAVRGKCAKLFYAGVNLVRGPRPRRHRPHPIGSSGNGALQDSARLRSHGPFGDPSHHQRGNRPATA